MLYAQYIRSVEMKSSQSTASVKLTVAGDTANKMRHEYAIGGDSADLMVLIDKIRRKKADPGLQILPKVYVKNGREYHSDRPGAIIMYSWVRVDFGEVHYNGEYTIKFGARAGQTVSSYKLIAPQLWLNVDNLFRTDRMRFDALSASVKDAYLMGTLCSPPVGFKPAVCDPDTGLLSGADVIPVDDIYSDEERDAIDGLNETPETPESDDDNNAPF